MLSWTTLHNSHYHEKHRMILTRLTRFGVEVFGPTEIGKMVSIDRKIRKYQLGLHSPIPFLQNLHLLASNINGYNQTNKLPRIKSYQSLDLIGFSLRTRLRSGRILTIFRASVRQLEIFLFIQLGQKVLRLLDSIIDIVDFAAKVTHTHLTKLEYEKKLGYVRLSARAWPRFPLARTGSEIGSLPKLRL